MYKVPDVDEVVAVAKELGIHLGPDEAVTYREYLIEQMDQLDTFVQARIEEEQPPMVSTAREPGYRPSAEEDPLNAWIWKCRIEGEAGGLLAGKTVSYKDHRRLFFRTRKVSKGTFDAALAQFGVLGLTELTNLMGCYSMLAFNVNAFGVELPEDSPEKPLPV